VANKTTFARHGVFEDEAASPIAHAARSWYGKTRARTHSHVPGRGFESRPGDTDPR
jgi:hypothetical protein